MRSRRVLSAPRRWRSLRSPARRTPDDDPTTSTTRPSVDHDDGADQPRCRRPPRRPSRCPRRCPIAWQPLRRRVRLRHRRRAGRLPGHRPARRWSWRSCGNPADRSRPADRHAAHEPRRPWRLGRAAGAPRLHASAPRWPTGSTSWASTRAGIGGSTPVGCGVDRRRLPRERPRARHARGDAAPGGRGPRRRRRVRRHRRATARPPRHREVVHDIEVIRRAIGEDRRSATSACPTGRSSACSGPRPTRLRAGAGARRRGRPRCRAATSPESYQVEAVDETFDAIDAACAADPACPLPSAGGVLAAYDELARRLDAGEVGGSGVGPTQLAYAAFSATYDSETLAAAVGRVGRAASTGDLRGVADLAGSFTGLVTYAPFAIVSLPRCAASRSATTPGRRPPTALAAQLATVRAHRSPTSCSPARSGRPAPIEPHVGRRRRAAADPGDRQHGRRRHPVRDRPCGSPAMLDARRRCSPSSSTVTSPSATPPAPTTPPPATSST